MYAFNYGAILLAAVPLEQQAQGGLDYRRTGQKLEIAVVILPDFDVGFDSGAYEPRCRRVLRHVWNIYWRMLRPV